jgi:hypothetical protein
MNNTVASKISEGVDRNRIITYSLLAHINNTGTLTEGLMEVFVPIVKRALSTMSREGVTKGKNISEIQQTIFTNYGLDMPIPVLRNILAKIIHEPDIAENSVLILYGDDAFKLNQYFFIDYEETIEQKERDIESVEKYFVEFCKIYNVDNKNISSVFHFIERNKYSISKYLSARPSSNLKEDNLIEAQFVQYFRSIPNIYQTIKDIYLGSIISTYIEYKTPYSHREIELVFDTNFVIGLLNLNTVESNHTCNKLVEIGKKSGFRLTVLDITIEECRKLLRFKSDNYKNAILQRKVNPEDIYSACERRNLSRTDLDRISDNLELLLDAKDVFVVPNTTKYRNQAKFSSEYRQLKEVRSTEFAALHDATATYYVFDKRGSKPVKNFEDVNCWFVHNSVKSGDGFDRNRNSSQPENIKADDLLNILWLANPGLTSDLDGRDLAEIGITSLISCTFNAALPRASIIKELDDNIQKYNDHENPVTEKDILRIATRISHRSLKNIEQLNEIAKNDPESFLDKVKEESEAQRHEEEIQTKKINRLIGSLEIAVKKADNISKHVTVKVETIEIEKLQLTKENSDLGVQNSKLREQLDEAKERARNAENDKRSILYKRYIRKKVRGWRLWSLIPILFFAFLYIFIQLQFEVSQEIYKIFLTNDRLNGNSKWGFIGIIDIMLNSVFVKLAYDRFFNESWRNAYVQGLNVPSDLKPI